MREMARLMPIEVDSTFTHVVEMLDDLESLTLQHEATLATSQLSYALTEDPVLLRTPASQDHPTFKRYPSPMSI